MTALDFFHRANADYLQRLFEDFERDPRSLDAQWQAFFAGFEAATQNGAAPRQPFKQRSASVTPLAQRVYDLVHSYRELGHCNAKLDPLGHERSANPLLELHESGLSEHDLDQHLDSSSFLGPPAATLRGLLA